jgi:hypothetical protein
MWALKAFRKVPSTRNYFEHIFRCLVLFFFFSQTRYSLLFMAYEVGGSCTCLYCEQEEALHRRIACRFSAEISNGLEKSLLGFNTQNPIHGH